LVVTWSIDERSDSGALHQPHQKRIEPNRHCDSDGNVNDAMMDDATCKDDH